MISSPLFKEVAQSRQISGQISSSFKSGLLFLTISEAIIVASGYFFDKYAEKFTYDKVHDGQWHMSFDIHDDPLTGVDNKTVTYLLSYKSKTKELDEIDKAIDDLCEELKKKWGNYPDK